MFRLLSYLAILVFSANVLGESSVSGTYALKWSKNAGCVIKAHQISKDKLQFELICNEGPGGNSGLALGVLDLKNSEAVFTRNISGMCEITLNFKYDNVEVLQNGMGVYCGFGMGVHASGTYQLRKSGKPSFKY